MAKQIVHMRIDSEIRDAVKHLSEEGFEGNFTAAIESLLGQALRMRMVDDRIRWEMYGHAKKSVSDSFTEEKDYKEFIDIVADGLAL